MSLANKLQKLIDGKQYVVDKVNAKTGSNLTIDSKWKDIGDTVETYEGGGGSGEDMLQARVDSLNSCKMLFYGYEGTSVDYISKLDTSKVATMVATFQNCKKIKSIPYLNTSNSTSFDSTFYECNALESIPLIDTSKSTNTYRMFYNCKALTTIPPLNISKVTNSNGMFYGCTALIETPTLDTISVTNMSYMFYSCYNLKKVDITHYKINSTSWSDNIWAACHSLKALIIRSFDKSRRTLADNCFNQCYHILGTTNATYNPNGDKDGYIYVPRDEIDDLKARTNWSVVGDQIRALEDYTIDGTTTGQFDDEKAGL